MPPVGLEPTISAGERPKTYALDRAATGTGLWFLVQCEFLPVCEQLGMFRRVVCIEEGMRLHRTEAGGFE